MKQITAIIQPQMLGKVVRTLHELPHFPGFTITDSLGSSFKITEDSEELYV